MKKYFWTLIIFLFAFVAEAVAQPIWFGPDAANRVTVEVLKPSFDGLDASFATSAVLVGGRLAVSDRVRLVAELPFAHFGAGGDSETGFGNPYAGIEFYSTDAPVFGEAGVRLPLASENAAFAAGIVSDLDRIEIFLPNTTGAHLLANYWGQTASSFSFRLRGGPSMVIPTKGKGDVEVNMRYAVQGWYDAAPLSIGAGVTGLADLDGGSLSERTVHQLSATALYTFGRARPGLLFRVPIDDGLRDTVDVIFGLSLSVQL